MSNEALFAAVERENDLTLAQRIEQIHAAIEAGADVNGRRQYGIRPLHDAVSSPHRASLPVADLEVIRTLIALGADVNAENDIGIRALNMAISKNDTDSPEVIAASKQVIALLREHGAAPGGGESMPLPHYTCSDPSMYELLLSIDDDIQVLDEEGNTPLHSAIRAQRPSIVRILLDRGAEINAVNGKRKTPLGLALKGDDYSRQQQQNKRQIVEMLQAAGAKERPPRVPRGQRLDPTRLKKLLNQPDVPSNVVAFLGTRFDSLEELVADLPNNLPTPDESVPALSIVKAAMGKGKRRRLSGDQVFKQPFFHHGDLDIDGHVQIRAPFAVTGMLKVSGCVRDCGPDSFVVAGDVTLDSLYTDGEFHVGGGLTAERVVFGHYNDNVLSATTIRAFVLIEDDHATWGEVEADHHFGMEDWPNGEQVGKRLRQIFIPELIDDEDGLNAGSLFERLRAGEPVFIAKKKAAKKKAAKKKVAKKKAAKNFAQCAKSREDKSSEAVGKSFLFTGKLAAMSRAEAKAQVAEIGGIVASSVKKDLDYLVVGDKGSPLFGEGKKGSKIIAAEKLIDAGASLRIISETEFLKMPRSSS